MQWQFNSEMDSRKMLIMSRPLRVGVLRYREATSTWLGHNVVRLATIYDIPAIQTLSARIQNYGLDVFGISSSAPHEMGNPCNGTTYIF